MFRLLLILPLVAACSTSGSVNTTDDTAETYTQGGPFYYPEVRQVLDTHCIRCHEGEGPGVGDFTDHDVATALADRMITRVDGGTMPPPTSDPECHDYIGSEHLNITDQARQVIADWIENDKPLGNPADQVEVKTVASGLEEWDLEITMPAPYVPTFTDSSNPNNEYRCFAIDHGRTEDFYINAMGPVIDQKGLIHHIVAYTRDKTDIPEHERLDGWSCINDASPDAGMLAGWAPGATPVQFEPGEGIKVTPDQYIIMQMHYYAAGPELADASDQSGYRFQTLTEDELERRIVMLPLGVYDSYTIPAGDASFTISESLPLPDLLDYKLNIHATFPHMHRAGWSYEAGIIRGDGTETCVTASDRWEFDNQLTYQFEEPIVVNKGDTIFIECTYNNSESNPALDGQIVDIHDGERTDEEMCFAFTAVSTDPPGLVNLIDDYL